MVHLLLVLSFFAGAAAPDDKPGYVEATALVRDVRERWAAAMMPRHLNRVLDAEIARLLKLLPRNASDTEVMNARIKFARYAGDADEFDRRHGVEGTADERIAQLARATGTLIESALAEVGQSARDSAQADLTRALVPLIEAHLLIGALAGNRPERFGLDTITRWWGAQATADQQRELFWRSLTDRLRRIPKWDYTRHAADDVQDQEWIQKRARRTMGYAGNVGDACVRALSLEHHI